MAWSEVNTRKLYRRNVLILQINEGSRVLFRGTEEFNEQGYEEKGRKLMNWTYRTSFLANECAICRKLSGGLKVFDHLFASLGPVSM
jgi:hypothetical protein